MVTIGMAGGRVQINSLAVDAFTALSQALLRTGYRARRTGGYNCRPIAGTNRFSLHSYGIAVDIDDDVNPHRHGVTRPIVFSPRATQAERAQDVRAGLAGTSFTPQQIAAVEAIRTVDGLQVFGWGGRWLKSHDAMHFEIVLTPDELRRGIAAQPSPSPSPGPVQPPRPSPAPSSSAGRFVVDHLPLLASHRGGRPALVIGWNNVDASTSAVDVVVHFHGFDDRGMRMDVLHHKLPISGLDFQDPAGSGTVGRTRPTVYLLPRGHNTGGRVFRFPVLARPGALRQLVDDALSRLRARLSAPGLRVDRLILTGHSGGGAGVLGALKHNDPDEVHIFDGLYAPADTLVRWALARLRCEQTSCNRPWAAMRVLYLRGADTTSHSRAVGRAIASQLRAVPASAPSLSRRFRVEETTVGHNDIPRTFGWRLLADPAADLPLTGRSSAGPRKPAQRHPAPPGRRGAPARPTRPGGRQAEFYRRFIGYARATEAAHGVPALFTLAQSGVETGWGASAPGNMMFGVKASSTDPPERRQLLRTREVLKTPNARFPEVISVTPRPDGRYDYVVRDWFRKYDSPEDSFRDHALLLRRRYSSAFAFAPDAYRFAREVARKGYATAPNYYEALRVAIQALERIQAAEGR